MLAGTRAATGLQVMDLQATSEVLSMNSEVHVAAGGGGAGGDEGRITSTG